MLIAGCSDKPERIHNARRFINEWNYDRALSELLALREDPDPEVQYLIGYCYLRKNEYLDAAEFFERALTVDTMYRDSVLRVYGQLAQNALKIEDAKKALMLYQEAARLVPGRNQARNLFIIGDIHYDQGNYPMAAAAYRQALAIDTTSDLTRRTRRRLIASLLACDSLDAAFVLAREQYDRSKISDNVLQLGEIRFARGRRFFEAGIIDSAKTDFLAIVGMGEPKSLLDDTHFYLGEIYARQDSMGLARESFKRVIRLNPYQKGDLVKRAQQRLAELKEQP